MLNSTTAVEATPTASGCTACHHWSLRGQRPERKTRSVSAKHQVSIKLVGNVCVLYLATAYASSLMISLPSADLYHFFRLFRRTAHFMSGSRQLFLFRLGRSFHINFFLKTKTIFKYSQREVLAERKQSSTSQSSFGKAPVERQGPPKQHTGPLADGFCSLYLPKASR